VSDIGIGQAVVLGVVEGLTEFLPVSSTGHLTITEKLMDLRIDDKGVTAFTAIIQIGAILAVIVYFWSDIVRMVTGFVKGLFNPAARAEFDFKFACYVIAGSVPIAVIGLAFHNVIEGALRSLWFVAGALIVWSGVMVFAEHAATQRRSERELTLKDVLIVGFAQCIALIPGVSRSGATISAGLLRDFDRVTATRLSFFLGIPALTAAGLLEAVKARDDISATVGWTPTLIATVVSFVVAYASVAWLLKFVAHHSIAVFVWYRVAVGALLIALLAANVISAT
jgi:undecaprenyl-diphosphatase